MFLFTVIFAFAGEVRNLRSADYAKLPQTRVMRAPKGGIQPQTAMDARGRLHMIFFAGDDDAGDIFYVHRDAGETEFSPPLRVNSQPESAVAVGTVRGPQMALGEDGRIEVVWFGSAKAQPRGPDGAVPVLFSRLNDAGTAFEPQRCVMQYAKGVDGGLSVAAGSDGEVYVVWHADGNQPGEAHRRVYLARSTDDGKTFAREVPISPAELGACGCCGMRATTDSQGRVYVFYRAAAEGVNRDMTLLASTDRGSIFRAMRVGPWKLNACPMSTASLSSSNGQVL
ncbi:MAG TPA: sialidase family protein, partial [Terriglobia bacterium]|nr:sialidase family protein [Terriglobia bacterium]